MRTPETMQESPDSPLCAACPGKFKELGSDVCARCAAERSADGVTLFVAGIENFDTARYVWQFRRELGGSGIVKVSFPETEGDE